MRPARLQQSSDRRLQLEEYDRWPESPDECECLYAPALIDNGRDTLEPPETESSLKTALRNSIPRHPKQLRNPHLVRGTRELVAHRKSRRL